MAKSVVVVGGGVAGLSAAIHARLRGYDVLLLEKGPLGGKAATVAAEGFRFDPGPSIIILTRLYDAVFQRAGRNPRDYLNFQRLDPFTRILSPLLDSPVDLPADRDACLDVIAGFAPDDVAGLRQLLQRLDAVAPIVDETVFDHPIDRPWQMLDPRLLRFGLKMNPFRNYKQQVDEIVRHPLLRAFFYGFPSYSGQTYRSNAPGAFLIPYYMLSEGVWYPDGGMAAIPQAFERLARELGVEFASGEVVRADRHRVETAEGTHEADAFICAADRLTAQGWFGRAVEAKPSYSYFTVQWGLRGAYDAIDHHTLFVPSEAVAGFADLYDAQRPPDQPVLYLNNPTRIDPSCAPTGHTNLFAVLTVPAMHDHLDWDALSPTLYETVLRQMREIGHLVEPDDIVVERIQSPPYFEAAHGSWRGSLYGPDEAQRLWGGMMPLPNRDPEHPNWFYAGGSVQPGAGLPMVTLSGKFAADLLP